MRSRICYSKKETKETNKTNTFGRNKTESRGSTMHHFQPSGYNPKSLDIYTETAKCDPQSKEKAISSDTPDVTKTLELVDNDLKQLVSPCARAYDE